jgi:Tol biopolymer transport system component
MGQLIFRALVIIFVGGIVLAGEPAISAWQPTRPALPLGILYISPADDYRRDLILLDPTTGSSRSLLNEGGLEYYAIRPDGTQIAYSHNTPDNTADIWILDVSSGISYPVTGCVRAYCHSPAWSPDGSQIVYEREDRLPEGELESRIWIVDLATLESRLLLDDPQLVGSAPIWAGQRIAWFDKRVPGIRVLNTGDGTMQVISTMQDVVGSFSPDGTQLVYPVLRQGALGTQFYTHLNLVNLDTEELTSLSGPDDAPVEDVLGYWSPDGQRILILRRYLDTRYTAGIQIYDLDPATGDAEPLIVDADINHSGVSFQGRQILYHQYPLSGSGPEVWLYDMDNGERTQIAVNAFLPHWLAQTTQP